MPMAIFDDEPKSKQGQCPSNLTLIQNTSYHEILQVFVVWIHNSFMLSLKHMMPLFKSIKMARSSLLWIS